MRDLNDFPNNNWLLNFYDLFNYDFNWNFDDLVDEDFLLDDDFNWNLNPFLDYDLNRYLYSLFDINDLLYLNNFLDDHFSLFFYDDLLFDNDLNWNF